MPSRLSLSSSDVARLVEDGLARLKGLAFDRAVVPDRPEFPAGFLKSEWSLRFRSRSDEATLLLSLRAQDVFLAIAPGKGARASEKATRSGFDLALNKVLDGLKVSLIEQFADDRIVTLWFADAQNPRRYGLVLLLFPALPEALLIEPAQSRFRVLARTRNVTDDFFVFPSPMPLKEDGRVRNRVSPLPENLDEWPRAVAAHRAREAFEQRHVAVSRELKSRAKLTEKRLAQLDTAEHEARREPEYAKWGDQLKSVMGLNPPLAKTENGGNVRYATDWESGVEVAIPSDPKLNLKQQIVRFYDLAKRKERRVTEAQTRRRDFDERLEAIRIQQRDLIRTERPGLTPRDALAELEKIESALGLKAATLNSPERKAILGWEGKIFFSQEGFPILVGRSKDENLELTFKFARGNDLWFHVRGKRGAHVVVPLRCKRTASLETLLDAASLTIYYSDGKDWGKTEVDYVQKKHIKRIKDSTEVSYTQNKTLLVALDPDRMKRLKPEG